MRIVIAKLHFAIRVVQGVIGIIGLCELDITQSMTVLCMQRLQIFFLFCHVFKVFSVFLFQRFLNLCRMYLEGHFQDLTVRSCLVFMVVPVVCVFENVVVMTTTTHFARIRNLTADYRLPQSDSSSLYTAGISSHTNYSIQGK